MSEFSVQDLTKDGKPVDSHATLWESAIEAYCIHNQRWGYDNCSATFHVPSRLSVKSVGLTIDADVRLGFFKKEENPRVGKFIVVIQDTDSLRPIATASSKVIFSPDEDKWISVKDKYHSKLFSPGETIDIMTKVADFIREAPVESCPVEVAVNGVISLPPTLDTFHAN